MLTKRTPYEILILGAFFILPAFIGNEVLLASFADDFYYYLEISNNLYNGKGLSFTEGITTNGFQPLHQLIIIIVDGFARMMQVDSLAFTRFAFGLIFMGLIYLIYNELRPSGLISYLIYLSGILCYFILATLGMEVLLLVPFLFIFSVKLYKKELSHWQLLSWIIFLFLVRIDSIVVTGLLSLIYLTDQWKSNKVNLRQISLVGLSGVLFLAVYLALNKYFFGTYLPISGVAKSVRTVSGIHPATFKSVFLSEWTFQVVVLLPIFLAMILSYVRKQYAAMQVIIVGIIAVYFIQNSIRSDWRVWSWYLFLFPVWTLMISYWIDQSAGAVMSSLKSLLLRGSSLFGLLASSAAVFFIILAIIAPPSVPNVLNEAGLRIKEFEKQHKGVYAMGDRAGVVGYLIDCPLVQLEGLVMNKEYLNRLHSSDNISDIMKHYKVDYYIATNPANIGSGKYVISEPHQSKQWKITDTISWPVVKSFSVNKSFRLRKSKSHSIQTVIFKVPVE